MVGIVERCGCFYFFFSSRRRHTRCGRDWSSDVCSSDLLTGPRMANSEFEPVKWHVKTLLKDLDMANTLSASMQSAIPMSGLGAEIMRLHASQGHADHDPSTLIDLYREKKG